MRLLILTLIPVLLSSCFLFNGMDKVEPLEETSKADCEKQDSALYVWQGRGWCNIENPSCAQLDSLHRENPNQGWKEPDTTRYYMPLNECLSTVLLQWPAWKAKGLDYNEENFNKRFYCIRCGENSYFTIEELSK